MDNILGEQWKTCIQYVVPFGVGGRVVFCLAFNNRHMNPSFEISNIRCSLSQYVQERVMYQT